jgi:hypothetical protein
LERFLAAVPEGPVEIQFEGGEPTVHPQFDQFVDAARSLPGLQRLVLCTNGAILPRTPQSLRPWLERLGEPCTLKLSMNYYLWSMDPGLLDLGRMIRDIFRDLGGDRQLVLNVRLRPSAPEEEKLVTQLVQDSGLSQLANVFYLQRYGLASSELDWQPPHLVGFNFRLVNPDGQVVGTDLVARSEAMKILP